MNLKSKKSKLSGAVLVIGGGVGGIQAALDLAGAGFRVHLAESSPAIGGNMAMLDKTFPTNDCSLCILSPKLVECGRNENINIMTLADVVGLTGAAGNFQAKILRRARYVDLEKCTGCGVCLEKCPRKYVSHPYLKGTEIAKGKMSPHEWQLRMKTAIARPYAQALPNAPAIDCQTCLKLTKGTCGVCQKVCLAGAIRYDDQDRIEEYEVGAVVVAPGYEKFSPYPKLEYGYSRFPDVVTGMEFERILSASGPYSGHVCCPSDGREPKRVAFLQCVGSRDISCRNGYCSSVCCMYAIKQAIIGREHLPGLESVIFNMDVRAFGKDFDKYYERARKEYAVRFERARVHSVEENGKDGKKLAVSFSPQSGGVQTENFDMVVLSVGLEPPAGMARLARGLGIRLNPYGFVWTDSCSPLRTSRPGVFVAGVSCGPKDIPETVMQASGAAAEAGRLLAGARMKHALPEKKKVATGVLVAGNEPRIGVIICHCGINIAGVVGVADVAKYAQTLPKVAHAETSLYACSQEAQKHIFALIEKHKLNRLVVASCSPRTHEPLFQATLREAGLNPHLFEMANIRDQCSWIHTDDGKAATTKACDLVRMAVAKVSLAEQLYPISLPVTQSALVVGGGVAGMTCAIAIADQGFKVYLLEKSGQFGGNLYNLDQTINGKSTSELLDSLVRQVRGHKYISSFLGARLHEIHGYVGNFTSTISILGHGRGKKENKEIKHGTVVVAVGAVESVPQEYGYGKNEKKSSIMTQLQFEKKFSSASFKPPESVVMIQCVGSREDGHMYCSRVCCSTALKNASRLRRLSPKTEVTILYRDLRSYGFLEEYFTQCRDLGVQFVRFDPEKDKPDVKTGGKRIKVAVFDEILQEKIELSADLLVLSARIDPNPDNALLSKMLKVPLNSDRFFLEAHVKLRPVDFATEGVFLAGMAHTPKSIEETISQANAAAARVCTIVSKKTIESEPIIACVNDDLCDGCGVCAPVCDYGALEVITKRDAQGIERKMVRVTEALCKGCGGCVAACPSGAMEQKGFKNKQILAMIDAALEG